MDSIKPNLATPAFRPTPPPQPPVGTNRSGSLNIVDEFTPQGLPDSSGLIPPPHGFKVEGSARETGYHGPINQLPIQENPLLTNQRMAQMDMQMLPQSPEQTRASLDTYVQNQSMALMLSAGAELQTQTQGGTRDAVTNFSFGAGASNAAENLYDRARLAWTPPGPNEPGADDPMRMVAAQLTQNLAGAFGVSQADLMSTDPAVSGPARSQFQQRLVEATSRSANSPQVQQFQQGYSEVVQRYEAQNNSVVISAGNEADLLQRMQADNGGTAIQAPPGFYNNALATPETTVVGAASFGEDGKPRVAGYSNNGDRVPILGFGIAPDGQPGTSFAAPRVAAVMEQIHRTNPGMSSEAVEHMMLRNFTTPVEGTHLLTM